MQAQKPVAALQKELKKKNVLTFFRINEEVTVDWFGHCSQTVTGLQGVVAIVNVRWVLEGQAALQIVLEEVHLGADVVILQDLLVIVEPAQLGVGVASNRELYAGIMALLGLSQSQDDWRNCRERIIQWWLVNPTLYKCPSETGYRSVC